MNNHSPWLEFERPTFPQLESEIKYDIAIVGGGIAGVSTLYFLLKNTDKNVVLLEKSQIASGATGHNAGFAVNFMEKVTQELIKEFGEEKVRNGFKEIDGSWNKLEEIMRDYGDTSVISYLQKGGLGFTSTNLLFKAIEEEMADEKVGRGGWRYLIASEVAAKTKIPQQIEKYLDFAPQKDILNLINIKDVGYIGAAVTKNNIIRKARINSTEFCYKVINFLKTKYNDRFTIYENSEISEIELSDSTQHLSLTKGNVEVKEVILCTNGYNNYSLVDKDTNKKITKLKENVISNVGYLVGYEEDKEEYTVALFDDRRIYSNVPYFYFHRAKSPKDKVRNFSIVGGPEKELSNPTDYDPNEAISDQTLKTCAAFLSKTFGETRTEFDYLWHGIMGYTKKGNRWVGRDRDYPNLLYNLGCNGIGLLPSIAGAEKIAKIINGDQLPPSMSDPS